MSTVCCGSSLRFVHILVHCVQYVSVQWLHFCLLFWSLGLAVRMPTIFTKPLFDFAESPSEMLR